MTTLQTCLGDLGTTTGKNANEIIVLSSKVFEPTYYIDIPDGVNVEITGSGQDTANGEVPAWDNSASTLVGEPVLNGSQENESASDQDFITVPDDSNLEIKGVNIETAAPQNFNAITNYGGLELDNVDFIGNDAYDIGEDQIGANVPNAVVVDSNLSFGNGAALITDAASTATFIDSDIVGNGNGGLIGNANLINTIVANNNQLGNGTTDCFENQGYSITATDSVDDDGSCVADDTTDSGVTTVSLASLKLGHDAANGGPTYSIPLGAGSVAIGRATTDCLPVDQRFYVTASTTSCDLGSYQTTGTKDTSVPGCPASGTVSTNSNGVLQDDVTVTPPLAGLGIDSVTAYTLTNTSGFTPGTVSWNTVTGDPFLGATDWDETTPSALEPDFDTRSVPFTVTATKFSSADNVAGDTHWSFPLTDSAGQTTTCS